MLHSKESIQKYTPGAGKMPWFNFLPKLGY